MAKLAIKGHEKRGAEVIALLEMLGGINVGNFDGDLNTAYYFISDYNNDIDVGHISKVGRKQYLLFSLEEFERKFPYKVGDKVQHKGSTSCGSVFEVEKMRWIEWTGTVEHTIKRLWYNNCRVTASVENLQPYKEETVEERKYTNLRIDVDQDDKLATEITIDGDKITPPENYLIGKITKVDNGMLVEFVKKQSQYPKTYKECCDIMKAGLNVLSVDYGTDCNGSHYNKKLENKIMNLRELLICRDAYWKIAGEEMGLGKPWQPDWNKNNGVVYYIFYCVSNGETRLTAGNLYYNEVLAFPIKEMRDAFFENFKELIEECKELL